MYNLSGNFGANHTVSKNLPVLFLFVCVFTLNITLLYYMRFKSETCFVIDSTCLKWSCSDSSTVSVFFLCDFQVQQHIHSIQVVDQYTLLPIESNGSRLSILYFLLCVLFQLFGLLFAINNTHVSGSHQVNATQLLPQRMLS